MEAKQAVADKATPKKRGTGFPVLSLQEAATLLKEAGKYGFEHSQEAIARYLGHESSTSGPFKRKLAALRDWDLIERNGERFAMTEIGKRIALPISDGDEMQALRAAFRSSEIFSKVYDTSAKGLPLSPTSIANSAIQNYGVSPASKNEFMNSLVRSAVLAGLAHEVSDGKVKFIIPEMDETSNPHARAHQTPDESSPNGSRDNSESNNNLRQTWPVDGGQITIDIHSSGVLSAAAFGQIAIVMRELDGLAKIINEKETLSSASE